MAASPLRYKKLLQEIPKHKSAEQALIASGFSPNTAKSQSKRVLASALKHQAREILKPEGTHGMTTKQLMSEIVGMSVEEVMERIRFIANQEKDLASALKVLIPLVRELGVTLDSNEPTVTVPVLNVVVESNEKRETLQANDVPDIGLSEAI